MGLLVVLTGPSGVGKSTICAKLLQRFEGAIQTVSSTTRNPRPGEENGVHYQFISREAFEEQLSQGAFLEHTSYEGEYYGTRRRMLEDLFEQAHFVIAVLDIEGCRQLTELGMGPLICPIITDDLEPIRQRLLTRSMSMTHLADRLLKALDEFSVIANGKFGEPIFNRDNHIDEAVDKIAARIEACLR